MLCALGSSDEDAGIVPDEQDQSISDDEVDSVRDSGNALRMIKPTITEQNEQ